MAAAASGTPDYLSKKLSTGRIRPSATGQPSASSPHTPLFSRSISSYYNSPSGAFRNDEENNVVFELGSRFMRIGVAGEATPRCIMSFGPDEHRRIGDYRPFMPGYSTRRKAKRGQEWGADHELWRNDIRELDLGLVEDKLERAVRKADGEILMLDDRKKRVTLVLASVLPRQLLSIALSTLFNTFQAQSVTLLPSPIACAASAGLRSALVLDIGWAETTATAIYEYREICQRRTVRAARTISEEMANLLGEELSAQGKGSANVSLEEAEEVLARLAWCRSSLVDKLSEDDTIISVPMPPPDPTTTLKIGFSRFSEPAEVALLNKDSDAYSHDAHDQSLPLLLYHTLLALPVDIRKICMSRIVFSGGASNIPGLKSRIIEDLTILVERRGWDAIRNYGRARKHVNGAHGCNGEAGAHAQLGRAREAPSPATGQSGSTGHAQVAEDNAESPSLAAAFRPQEPDVILSKIREATSRRIPPAPEGEIRAIGTLGAWAGGSLMASLRVKGVVEVERDSFLQYGLSGASREKEVTSSSKSAQRQSLVGGGKSGAGERANWTLGLWA